MRYVILGLILCVAVFVGHRPVAAEPLRIVYTAISLMYGPLWVTQQAGLLKKYNLDVELLYLSGGTSPQRRWFPAMYSSISPAPPMRWQQT